MANEIGKPIFSNIFGNNNTIKVIDFLFMGKDFDFTLTQLCNGTGLSRTAIRHALKELVKTEIVILSREDTKSKYYKINTKNTKFKALENLHKQLILEIIDD